MNEKLAKYFSGECTQDEIDHIESWRGESENNSKEFFEAKNIWVQSQSKLEPNMSLLREILDETQEKEGKVVSIRFNWIKYAAAAVVVIGLAFAINLYTTQTDSNFMALADGSEITLHDNAEVTSVTMSDNMREIRLTGKAYFDIERDESRPFVIVTESARIEVLGTSFVIDATEGKTDVLVESGLVSLIKPGMEGKTDLSVNLAKGEMGTVERRKPGIIKRNNTNLNYLAWKTKTVTFNRSKMSNVEKVLEDVYGIDIVFENENLKNCNLTAKFNERRAKDAVEIIAKTFNLTVDFKDGKVFLRGKGC